MKNSIKNYLVLSRFAVILTLVACKSVEDMTPAKSSEKSMSSFSFSSLSPAVSATITGTTVSAVVPFNVDVTSLAPTITVAAKATVSPASGSTQNFTNAVTYTVKAEDGTTAAYSVTVTKGIAPKSTAKDITKFSFAALSPVVDATIDATAKTIKATLPATTDITKLVPTITISDKATVSPASGVATDFSKEVSYTVTAEDASTVVWKVNVKKEVVVVTISNVDPTPAIENSSDAIYFINGSGDLTCVDLNTQEEKWRFKTVNSGFSKPTIANGILYLRGSSRLIAIDSETGTEKWRATLDKSPYFSPGVPSVDGGIVFIANEGTVYAFDAITGQQLWNKIINSSYNGQLVAKNGVVYVGDVNPAYKTNGKTYALDGKSGELKWVNDFGFVFSAFYNGFLFGTNEYKGGVFAIDANTGIQKWGFNYSSYYGKYPVAVSNGIMFSGDDSKFFAIDVNTGKQIWASTIEKTSTANITVINGTLIVSNGKDKKIHAYNASTGTEKWVDSISDNYGGQGTIAIKDKLYVGSYSGGFYMLNTDTGKKIDGFEKISKSGQTGYNFLIVQNKKVYELNSPVKQ